MCSICSPLNSFNSFNPFSPLKYLTPFNNRCAQSFLKTSLSQRSPLSPLNLQSRTGQLNLHLLHLHHLHPRICMNSSRPNAPCYPAASRNRNRNLNTA
jgi:hypothetical protein